MFVPAFGVEFAILSGSLSHTRGGVDNAGNGAFMDVHVVFQHLALNHGLTVRLRHDHRRQRHGHTSEPNSRAATETEVRAALASPNAHVGVP